MRILHNGWDKNITVICRSTSAREKWAHLFSSCPLSRVHTDVNLGIFLIFSLSIGMHDLTVYLCSKAFGTALLMSLR